MIIARHFKWVLVLFLANHHFGDAFNSFVRPTVKPVARSIHFAKSSELYLKTGEAVINFELPLQAAVCLARNFNDAVHRTHPVTTNFGKELRIVEWAKLKFLDNTTKEIEDTLEIMRFDEALYKHCDKPQYQVLLDTKMETRKAKRPSPPTKRPIPTVDPNCQALRLGASCGLGHRRSRRSVGKRPRRQKRQTTRRNNGIFGAIRSAASDKLGEMAATAIERHITRRNKRNDEVKYDGFNLFATFAEKLTRGITGMNIGSIVQAGGAIADTLMYFKVASRLQKLTEHVTEIDTRVGEIAIKMVSILETLKEETLGHLYQRVQKQIEDFRDELNRILDAITQGRFPRDMFDMPAFKKAVEALELEAAQYGDALLDTSPMAALQSPMGWSLEDTGNLNVFLRLDTTRDSLRMVLHQMFLTPFPTADGPMIIDTAIKFIAVTKTPSNTFLVMTADEYKSCRNTAGKLICPDARLVHKKDLGVPGFNDAMCAYAAFSLDNTAIKKYCTFTRPKQEESLQSVSDNEFVGYSNRSLQVSVSCHTSGSHHLETPPGAFILELPDGCKADTPAHTVWNIYLLSAQSIYLRRAWSTPEALTSIISLSASDIQFLIDTKHTLEDLAQRHIEESRHFQESQTSWFGEGAILFGSLFALLLALVVLYCGCKNKEALCKAVKFIRNKRQQKKQTLTTHSQHGSNGDHTIALAGPTPSARTTVNNGDLHA